MSISYEQLERIAEGEPYYNRVRLGDYTGIIKAVESFFKGRKIIETTDPEPELDSSQDAPVVICITREGAYGSWEMETVISIIDKQSFPKWKENRRHQIITAEEKPIDEQIVKDCMNSIRDCGFTGTAIKKIGNIVRFVNHLFPNRSIVYFVEPKEAADDDVVVSFNRSMTYARITDNRVDAERRRKKAEEEEKARKEAEEKERLAEEKRKKAFEEFKDDPRKMDEMFRIIAYA